MLKFLLELLGFYPKKTPTAGIEPASPEGRGYLPSPQGSQRVSQPEGKDDFTPKEPFRRKETTLNPKGKS